MIDAKIVQSDAGYYDLSVENGDLAHDDGFETAIWVSLFTDARASSAQVLQPEYRRGWPGNTVSTVNGRQLGGLLWLVDQRRLNQATLNEAIDYARSSLKWLIEDNAVKSVDVDGVIVPTYGIELSVTITSFTSNVETHYVKLWEVTASDN